jgi:hypothetical protein
MAGFCNQDGVVWRSSKYCLSNVDRSSVKAMTVRRVAHKGAEGFLQVKSRSVARHTGNLSPPVAKTFIHYRFPPKRAVPIFTMTIQQERRSSRQVHIPEAAAGFETQVEPIMRVQI